MAIVTISCNKPKFKIDKDKLETSWVDEVWL
jgi:hypothetical protein